MCFRLAHPCVAAALLVGATLATTFAQPLTRTAATSLRLPSAPPSSTYTTERVFTGITFSQPVSIVTAPGETHRLFVVEKTGRIILLDHLGTTPTRSVFLDLAALIGDTSSEQGLLALAFHPQFASNGYFYVWFTLSTTTSAGTGRHDRLARFRVSPTNPNLGDITSQQPLISQFDEAANHNGGQLAFGPDGYLYLSIGDEGGANDQYSNSQRIDKDFFAGLFRLDVDQRPGSLPPNAHPAIHAGTYTIPPDNPFVGATTFNNLAVNPAAVRTEFWAVGLRNPWRFSFDSGTGALWCADVGQGAYEEIDLIRRGGNYGWNYREADHAGVRTPPAGLTFDAPVWEYPHTVGQSISGGFVYRGSRYPSLYGRFLYADYEFGPIWALLPDGTNPVNASRVQPLATDAGVVSFGLNPSNGDILITDVQESAIKRLVVNTATGSMAFPATLTETGAFNDVASLAPAPGVVAYAPNVSFWSDHAQKRRWFALTDATSTYGFSPDSAWTLPTGAVWVKHFDLELRRGDPTSARRVETRFLVKTATGVYGLSYRWNDAQTNATLVAEEGADQTFSVTENGATRSQTWHFPSRAECLACHTERGGFALSFNTRQLNRGFTFPGGTANTLTALAQAGYLNTPTPPAAETLPALAAGDDDTKSLELRARSYLDANCAQCHQPGGNAASAWDARASTPLSLTGILNGALSVNGGNPANRVLVPGDPAHSQLLARLAGNGVSRMPPLATNERDLAGETLLAQWISSLAPTRDDRLVNLSARALAGLDAETLTTGFVVSGAAKSVLVRAIGPTLTQFGVNDPLAQPTLTLRPLGSETVIASNTRWSTAPNLAALRASFTATGAFPLPDASADSALLTTLAPGAYTAQATGVSRSTGVALIEVYDADGASPDGHLANASVRARVGVDDQILIPGLTIGGTSPRTVLIRAAGPALAGFGVSGALAQPVVKIFIGSQEIASNAGWASAPNLGDIRAATTSTGAFIFAENSRDSALLVTLAPGGYTIQLSGANRTSGVALVEVYEVP